VAAFTVTAAMIACVCCRFARASRAHFPKTQQKRGVCFDNVAATTVRCHHCCSLPPLLLPILLLPPAREPHPVSKKSEKTKSGLDELKKKILEEV